MTEIVPRRAELVPRTPPVPAPKLEADLPQAIRARLRTLLIPPRPLTYLAAGETCAIASRRHWLLPLKKISGGLLMMAGVGLLTTILPGVFLLQLALGLGALAHTVYIAWCVIGWRLEQIIVTDSRLLRVHGIVTLTVDAVQLSQVTDVTLRCTIPGRILNYGTLTVETAGQRPVQRLNFVPAPAAVYRGLLR